MAGDLGLKRVLHWGPLVALTIITLISVCGFICLLQWWPIQTFGGSINLSIYIFWNITILYNFFNAMYIGPGNVPFGWKPQKKADEQYMQYCNFCEGFKPPRSHHCRKCERCVMKMDHHCPWINNCVGHYNHAYFTYFLFFAPMGCMHALLILIPAMYRAVNRHYYLYYGDGTEPIIVLSINKFVACMFAVGLAVGVVIAVGGLFFIQVKTILRNETGIETWIIEKARYRRYEDEDEEEFEYPYHLGRWNNWKMVFTWMPDRRMDGTWWPVVEGCNQYTLTVEQIQQKKEKQERSVIYKIQEAYSGSIFPVTKGLRVGCCPPCTDEPRIALRVGDMVRVSRWKKRWLYGDKLLDGQQIKKKRRERGWFPRKCAVEIYENGDATASTNQPEDEKKEN